MTPERSEPGVASGDPFVSQRLAIDTFRSSAKWAIAAVGGIGALLISSIPLGNLGAVESTTDRLLAGLGVLGTVGGVLLVLVAAVNALRPRAVHVMEIPECPEEHLPVPRLAIRDGAVIRRIQNRILRNRDGLFPSAIASRPKPVEGLRRAQVNQADLIDRKRHKWSEERLATEERRLAALNTRLTRLAWIVRYEHGAMTYRRSVLATAVGVFAVALGMVALLVALHDRTAQAQTEAQTDKLVAETEQIRASLTTTTVASSDEGDDELPDPDHQPEDIVITFGDVNYGSGGGQPTCSTTDQDGIRQLEEIAAALVFAYADTDAGPLGLTESEVSQLLEIVTNRFNTISDLSDAWEILFGTRAGDREGRICADWPSIVNENVNQLAGDAGISDSLELQQFVISDLQSRFSHAINGTTGGNATTTVIIDNELNNTTGMD